MTEVLARQVTALLAETLPLHSQVRVQVCLAVLLKTEKARTLSLVTLTLVTPVTTQTGIIRTLMISQSSGRTDSRHGPCCTRDVPEVNKILTLPMLDPVLILAMEGPLELTPHPEGLAPRPNL